MEWIGELKQNRYGKKPLKILDVNRKVNVVDMKDYIVLKGRCGLEYYDQNGIGFFADTELCAGSDYDYAIYIDSIVSLKDNLPPNRKNVPHIMDRILYLCRERKMKPKIFRDNK